MNIYLVIQIFKSFHLKLNNSISKTKSDFGGIIGGYP